MKRGDKGRCAVCEKEFTACRKTQRFCSVKCSNAARPRKTLVQLFATRVKKSPGCWTWIGWVDKSSGYGRIAKRKDGKQHLYAHHAAWEIAHGEPVPEGMWVLHECDNPKCVRPSHLFLGTVYDNNADMKAKHRNICGERVHWFAKLTLDDVKEIKRLRAAGNWTHRKLAAKFGVGTHAISMILRGKSWKTALERAAKFDVVEER